MNSIFTPYKIGNLELKNRIIFAPTSMDNDVERIIEKMDEIASGGCAMIIVGDVPVLPQRHMSLYSDEGFEMYRRICETVHSRGCLVSAQLHQSDTDMKFIMENIPKMKSGEITADDLRKMLNDRIGDYISSIPVEKVKNITSSFGKAALLCKKAGFDMIQIHGDRMCGSFSSTLFNTRKDEYGGSLENRAKFAIDSIKSVKKAVPDMPVEYKLSVRQENPDYGKAGITVDEISEFVPMLEDAGIDSFHVALANHSSLTDTIPPSTHKDFGMEGCFLKFADEVRKYTELPICSVGGLTDPAFIEKQISSERVQFVSMCRQLIADSMWPQKVKNGNTEDIKKCIRCNKKCLGGIQHHKGVGCIFD